MIIRFSTRLQRTALTGLLLSTVAGAALGQEDPKPSQDAKPAAVAQGQRAEDQVGAIIVTARRREENAQSVPIALTVNTAQTLEQTGIANVVQLTQLVPTLQVLSPQRAQYGHHNPRPWCLLRSRQRWVGAGGRGVCRSGL